VHAGYEHFPAGTTIFWKVKQDGLVAGTGHFVTESGSGYHFVTQSIGVMLNASPDTGTVRFSWSVHGVYGRVQVKRAPGCSGTSRSGEPGLGDIFRVDLKSCVNLHVDYQYFPADTLIAWGVRQSGHTKSFGHFRTASGLGYHFLTQPLGTKLTSNVTGDVIFWWKLHGQLMHYIVHTSPGC
jgi:hypothetical protein